MNKIPDCLEKQAHYSSINIQDKKEGVAIFSKECKTNLESRKVKCGVSHNKHWEKSTKYASCISSR